MQYPAADSENPFTLVGTRVAGRSSSSAWSPRVASESYIAPPSSLSIVRSRSSCSSRRAWRRESIPVASAVPPPDEPVKEVPSQPPALQTTVVPIDPESGSGGRGER